MTDHTEPTETESLADPRVQQEVQLLKKAIGRGFDVEAFMGSEIGQYLRLRASREIEEAQEALIDVDAFDATRIRDLQLQARVGQRVLSYLADAITEGENAERMLQATYDQQRAPD